MIRVFYKPPAGSKPFLVEASGTTWVIQPPDQYWKQVDEEYIIGRQYNQFGHLLQDGTKMGKRATWVLDEEKNRALAEGRIDAPDNSAFWSEHVWKQAMKSKFKDKGNKYLVKSHDLYKNMEAELQAARVEHAKRLEQERKALEYERTLLRAEHEKELAEIAGQLNEMKAAKKPKTERAAQD